MSQFWIAFAPIPKRIAPQQPWIVAVLASLAECVFYVPLRAWRAATEHAGKARGLAKTPAFLFAAAGSLGRSLLVAAIVIPATIIGATGWMTASKPGSEIPRA